MGKHQIMSVPKEARGTSDWDMFATWVGGKCRQRNVVYRRSHCGLRVCGRNESFGIVVCRVLSVFESDRLHWLQDGRFDDGTEQNIFSILDDFVILSRPRGPDLEPVVEHFSDFWRFCSTFGAARTGFGVSGRTFFQFLEILFYFRGRADRIWSRRQNIFPIFGDFVLLSRPRTLNLDQPVDKKEAFPPFFVYFRFRAPRFWRVRQTKKRHFSRFLSTFESARPEFRPAGRQKKAFSPFFVCFPFELQSGLRAKNRFSNLARKLLMQHGNSTRSRHRLLPLHCIFHADKELRQKQIIHASPKMQCHPHQKNQSISLIF